MVVQFIGWRSNRQVKPQRDTKPENEKQQVNSRNFHIVICIVEETIYKQRIYPAAAMSYRILLQTFHSMC